MNSNHLVGKVYHKVSHVQRSSQKKIIQSAIKISLHHFYNSRERLHHDGCNKKKQLKSVSLVVHKVAIQKFGF